MFNTVLHGPVPIARSSVASSHQPTPRQPALHHRSLSPPASSPPASSSPANSPQPAPTSQLPTSQLSTTAFSPHQPALHHPFLSTYRSFPILSTMAPPTLADADFFHVSKHFKNPKHKSSGKRLKNLKAALIEEQKRLALMASNPTKATYFSLEAPPSLKPIKHYCDITGLEGKYKSTGNGLRYHNAEIYAVVRELGPGVDQEYLSLRNANVILR